ncbi:MAG: LysR family transcriptional regulator [Sphingomonadales bacterium]|nr:LysR family transcriptional regulator [Sphingomonadales bacterium]MDE2172103.1 LysR family transcriptional regulator [Sphingomonadales bacterium]
MLDDLNELKTFRAILTAGSLSGAARDLGISLQVASKRLAMLEQRAGVRLINRTTRSLSATEEGARLLLDVERGLDAFAAGEDRLINGRDEPVGTLRVSAPVSFGRRHVAPVLGALVARYPRLFVSLKLDDRLADLVGDGLDVAIRIGPMEDSSAMARKLADNHRILIASPAYLNVAGRPEAIEDLHQHQFLRYGESSAPWTLFGPGGTRQTVGVPARLRADNGDAVHDWAVSGLGIALKSELDVAEDIGCGRLERVLPEWNGGDTPVVALYPSGRNLPLKTRAFLDAAVSHLRYIRGSSSGR